jgi:hypothetical protein
LKLLTVKLLMVVDLEATPIYLSAEEEEGDVDISGKY